MRTLEALASFAVHVSFVHQPMRFLSETHIALGTFKRLRFHRRQLLIGRRRCALTMNRTQMRLQLRSARQHNIALRTLARVGRCLAIDAVRPTMRHQRGLRRKLTRTLLARKHNRSTVSSRCGRRFIGVATVVVVVVVVAAAFSRLIL